MSFGGTVFAMIQSLKLNARPKHKAYQDWNKKEQQIYSGNQKLIFKVISKEKLAKIKAKNTREIENQQRRQIIISTIILAIFIPLIVFVFFNFFFEKSQSAVEVNTVKPKIEKLSQDQTQYLINDGLVWLNKGHYKNARYQFNRVLKEHP